MVGLERSRGPLRPGRGLPRDCARAFARLEGDSLGESILGGGSRPASSGHEGCLQLDGSLLAAEGIGQAPPQSAAGASQPDHHDQPNGKPHLRKLDPESPVAKGAQPASP